MSVAVPVTRERVLGALVVLCALCALFWIIPAQTEHIERALLQPGFFPSLAAVIVLISAIVHMAAPKGFSDGPPIGVIARNLSVLVGFALAAVLGMRYLGYYVTAPLLLAFSTWYMGERRPLWLVIGVAGTTLVIWVMFELVLQRPLP